MTEGVVVLNLGTVDDLALDYANGKWSDLLKALRADDDPRAGLYRSILESVRDALNAETEARVTARLEGTFDDTEPEDFGTP